jgi:hypothetical protein
MSMACQTSYFQLDRLVAPGPRLSWIKRWLLDEVWSRENYQKLKPVDFLHRGESAVNDFEQLLAAAADRTYSELLSGPDPGKGLLDALSSPDSAVVVFDGLSLREIPMLLGLAEQSGLKICKTDASLAAVPCETMDFIDRELPCGRIAPSQLPGRKELKERGIAAVYNGNHTQGITTNHEGTALLVWSAFPDLTYRDSGAKFDSHFENIHAMFETAWMNTVQRIKGKRRIVVTSDHGYIFFGAGMDFPRQQTEVKDMNAYFGNDRHASLTEKPDPPVSDDVYRDSSRQVALIKGRVKTRSTGEAAAKLYKHGGLSLMEMLVPWIELETL